MQYAINRLPIFSFSENMENEPVWCSLEEMNLFDLSHDLFFWKIIQMFRERKMCNDDMNDRRTAAALSVHNSKNVVLMYVAQIEFLVC